MSPDALAARLAALERSHRRLRALVATLALGLAAALLLGAGSDGALVGRSLKLLDDQGRLRVLMTTNAGLSFLDPNGRAGATLGPDNSGAPGLVLNGAASRAVLNVNADGPALTLMGERGKLRGILGVVSGQPGLVFFDGDERERARLAVVEGSGYGMLRDADGGTTWQMPNR